MRIFFSSCFVLFSLVFCIYAQPDIDPVDLYHDFGRVGVGLESEWDLVIVNIGDGALYMSSVIPNLSEVTISQPTFPLTMTPGESVAVTVVFQPSAVGHVGGFIEVISNDPDEGLLTIDVEGEGIDVAHISAPDSLVPAGAQIFLPVRIDDATGLGITSLEMRLVFDERIVTASGASLIGTLAESWSMSVESSVDQIEMHLSGPIPLVGTGVVVFVDLSVTDQALPGESTPLILTDVVFNDGVPLAIPHNGLITVAQYDISGEVTYYRGAVPVDGVLLSLQGGAVGSTWTDATGFYRFEAVPGGRNYTVTPTKAGEVWGSINSYDAALVMRYSISMASLNPLQLIAADVSADGTVGGLDASYILRFRVGMIDHFPIGDEWLFLPEKMDYDSLGSAQSNQDYTALAYGDVSGNWSGGGAQKHSATLKGIRIDPAVMVSTSAEDVVFSVPVVIEGAEGISAADFDFSYDRTGVHSLSVQKANSTSDYMLFTHHHDGCLRVAMAGTEDLYGDVPLLYLLFEVSSEHSFGAGIPLEISATVNDGIVVADHHQIVLSLERGVIPADFRLEQNRPNPFNPSTHIQYHIVTNGSPVQTTIQIFNVLGQEVRTLVDEPKESGYYSVPWDGKDSFGRDVTSGLYYYRMVAGSFHSSKQMVLLR